jgi:hypothetical protein
MQSENTRETTEDTKNTETRRGNGNEFMNPPVVFFVPSVVIYVFCEQL